MNYKLYTLIIGGLISFVFSLTTQAQGLTHEPYEDYGNDIDRVGIVVMETDSGNVIANVSVRKKRSADNGCP